MKKFTTEEIRDLYNQFSREEISFSRMVEVINQRISESEVREYKDGDFLHSDWDDENITIIFKNQESYRIYYHASKSNYHGLDINDEAFWNCNIDFHHATEAEKQELLDELAKEGKRWNEEKKCVEDIPKRKFKKGDKVRIKDGVSSKTHKGEHPCFASGMDDLIGKTMTIELYCDRDIVLCDKLYWQFKEDWLEPYVEELKEGDLAIFWDNEKEIAIIKPYGRSIGGEEEYFQHKDQNGFRWRNAIKFESREQFERLIKGEI